MDYQEAVKLNRWERYTLMALQASGAALMTVLAVACAFFLFVQVAKAGDLADLDKINAPLTSDAWVQSDYVALAASELMLFRDYRQTRDMTRWYATASEANPILGKYPTPGHINAYFGSVMVGNVIVADLVGAKFRTGYLVGVTVVELFVTGHNASIGLSGRF